MLPAASSDVDASADTVWIVSEVPAADVAASVPVTADEVAEADEAEDVVVFPVVTAEADDAAVTVLDAVVTAEEVRSAGCTFSPGTSAGEGDVTTAVTSPVAGCVTGASVAAGMMFSVGAGTAS